MLTKDKKRLSIFANGISVDETLPKYTRVKEELEKRKNTGEKGIKFEENGPWMDTELVEVARGETFERFRDMDTHEINVFLSEKEYNHLLNGGRYSLLTTPNIVSGDNTRNPIVIPVYKNVVKENKSFIKRLFGKGKEEPVNEETIDKYEFDVVEFFSEIKKNAKLNKDAYANRVDGYISALKTADIAGQEVFKERLLKDLVINKYESILYATGNYYVVPEETAVEFAKKSEKGVNLVYAKNYLRPIPIEIVDKIAEMNELEIFDNYVIMHYDPENKYSDKTHAEKVKEEDKKRDPILFGVIAGSNKLYYIADWVDEYCNLTLEEFVTVLQMDKDKLKMSEKAEF